MSDETEVKGSRYDILVIDDKNHSVLRRKTNGYSSTRRFFEVLMPNVGSAENARFIIEKLEERDDLSRRAAEEREREFQRSLTEPHEFVQATSRVALCYCGKPSKDPIHIEKSEGSPSDLEL